MRVTHGLDGGKTQMLRPGLHWDGTLKGPRFNLLDLDGAEMSLWWRWEENLVTWIELRCDMDEGEMNILKPGWLLPWPPSAPMGIVVGHCIWLSVPPSVHLPVCPSVHPERCYHSNSLRVSVISLGWYTVPWSRSLFEMAMLSQFLRVPLNLSLKGFFWGATLPL